MQNIRDTKHPKISLRLPISVQSGNKADAHNQKAQQRRTSFMEEKHTTHEKSSLKADISNEEAAELHRIMSEAFAGNPFMTPNAAAVMLGLIVSRIEQLKTEIPTASNIPQWGTVGQIATIYNYSPERMGKLLTGWTAQGKIRIINPIDPSTERRGVTKYNLADVHKLMAA